MKSDNWFKIAMIILVAFIAYQLWLGNKLKESAFAGNTGQLAAYTPQTILLPKETASPTNESVWKKVAAVTGVLSLLWKIVEAYLGN